MSLRVVGPTAVCWCSSLRKPNRSTFLSQSTNVWRVVAATKPLPPKPLTPCSVRRAVATLRQSMILSRIASPAGRKVFQRNRVANSGPEVVDVSVVDPSPREPPKFILKFAIAAGVTNRPYAYYTQYRTYCLGSRARSLARVLGPGPARAPARPGYQNPDRVRTPALNPGPRSGAKYKYIYIYVYMYKQINPYKQL